MRSDGLEKWNVFCVIEVHFCLKYFDSLKITLLLDVFGSIWF